MKYFFKCVFVLFFIGFIEFCSAESLPTVTAATTPATGVSGASLKATQQLTGYLLEDFKNAPLLGDVEKDKILYLLVGLPMNNSKENEAFGRSLYDPNSPNYRKWLTPEQYGERYGVSEESFQKVIGFLKSHGFAINQAYKNRLGVSVKGTVKEIQDTFHIRLQYHKRLDGSQFFCPDREPSVDLDVPLLHISGLDNFGRIIPVGPHLIIGTPQPFRRQDGIATPTP